MKAIFSIDSDNEHYEKAIALAKADSEHFARIALANDPDKLAGVLAKPELGILGMLLRDCIAYTFEASANIEEAHSFLHSVMDTLDTIHAQVAQLDPHNAKKAVELAPEAKNFVN